MKKYSLETVVGIFVVIGLLCIGYMTFKLGKVSMLEDDYYSLYASFGSVSGLRVDSPIEIHGILRRHLADLYAFYGEQTGVRIARKHISWYTKGLVGAAHFRHAMNQLDSVAEQLAATDDFFLGYGNTDAANDRSIYEETLAA